MRKFFWGIILLIFFLLPSFGIQEREDYPNSNDFFQEVLSHSDTSIKKICTYQYCDQFSSAHLSQEVERYKNNYFQYLKKEIGEEKAISTILKGFPITKVFY